MREVGATPTAEVKSDRRSRRSRRLIADAFIALMLERPYDRITVQDIIDRADVGRSTFYAHYRDKEDVLVSESERVLALFYAHVDAQGSASRPLIPSLELFRHVDEFHHLYLALVRGHAIQIFYQTWQHALRAGVEQRLATHSPQTGSAPIPLPILADYVAGTFLHLLRWWLEHDRPHPPERMDEIFRQLIADSCHT